MGVPLQMYSGVILTYLVSAAAVHWPEMDTVLITISLPRSQRLTSQARHKTDSSAQLKSLPLPVALEMRSRAIVKNASAPGSSTRPSSQKLFAHKPALMSSVSPHFGKH